MFVIFGLGIQGKAILHYLLSETDEQVFTYDPFVDKEEVGLDVVDPMRWVHRRASYSDCLLSTGDDRCVAISCLPTSYNEDAAKHCISNGWDWIDLGGDTKIARNIAEFSKEHTHKRGKKPTVIPDCGVAPGLVSSIAFWGEQRGYSDVRIYCGGLPVTPNPPLSYIKAFSSQGVIKEYSGLCEVIVGGEKCLRPALGDFEYVSFPGLGVLEACNTSGSVSTAAEDLDLYEFRYKTLRYPGHWSYVRDFLMSSEDPVGVLDRLLDPVSADNPDLLVLKVEFRNHVRDADEQYSWRWDFDYDLGIGAMAQITGYTAAAVAAMVHEGEVGSGHVPMHYFNFLELKRRISSMPNQFLEGCF